MKKYFLIKDGEKCGPYSISELQNIEFDSSTLFWSNELEEWTEAGKIEELNLLLKSFPPPIPEIKVRSTINVRIVEKSKNKKYTKDEKEEKFRIIIKKTLLSFGVLISILIVSLVIAIFTYLILLKKNQPELVPLQNQKEFNIKVDRWQSDNKKWNYNHSKWLSEITSVEKNWDKDFLKKYYPGYVRNNEIYLSSGFYNIVFDQIREDDPLFDQKQSVYVKKRKNDYKKQNPNFEFEWHGGSEPIFDISLVNRYLGTSKYDDICLPDCSYDDRDRIWKDVNTYRINNLKRESEYISTQVFFLILGVSYFILLVIVIVRCLRRFIKWLQYSNKQ